MVQVGKGLGEGQKVTPSQLKVNVVKFKFNFVIKKWPSKRGHCKSRKTTKKRVNAYH
jgi:hypothetical protein